MNYRRFAIAATVLLGLYQGAHASIVLTTTTQNLLPNAAGQSVQVRIAADGSEPAMVGLNLYAQWISTDGATVLPTFTGVSYSGFAKAGTGGATFYDATGNDAAPYTVLVDQLDFLTAVAVDQATITFSVSTQGITGGQYQLILQDVIGDSGNDTTFVDSHIASVPVTTGGGLIAVPEPTSLGLVAVAGMLAVRRVRRD